MVGQKALKRLLSVLVLSVAFVLALRALGAHAADTADTQAPAVLLAPNAQTITHTVQPGDTLTQLANRYGVSVTELVTLNDIEDPDLIRVGQVLTISSSPGPTPTPQPAAGPRTITVQPGDTLAKLAAQYGGTVDAWVATNDIEDRNLIRVGQVLTVPASAGPVRIPTPQPAGGPLIFTWSLIDWRPDDPNYIATLRIEAQGGQPPYTYYHDGLVQEGATFEIAWRRCRPKPGSVGVSDANGTRLNEDYWLEAPYCPVGLEIVEPDEDEELKHLPRHFNIIWEHTVDAPPPEYGIEIEVWEQGDYHPWQEYRHRRGDKPLFFVPDEFPGDLSGRVRMWCIYEGLFDGPKTPWRHFKFRVTY